METEKILQYLDQLKEELEKMEMLFLYGIGVLFTVISGIAYGIHGWIGAFRILFLFYCLWGMWKCLKNGQR